MYIMSLVTSMAAVNKTQMYEIMATSQLSNSMNIPPNILVPCCFIKSPRTIIATLSCHTFPLIWVGIPAVTGWPFCCAAWLFKSGNNTLSLSSQLLSWKALFKLHGRKQNGRQHLIWNAQPHSHYCNLRNTLEEECEGSALLSANIKANHWTWHSASSTQVPSSPTSS